MSQENLRDARTTAWYVSKNGSASGPFGTDMVLSMLRDGQLLPLDLVFREGETEWRPVASFRELKTEGSRANSQTNTLKLPPISPNQTSTGDARDSRSLSWIVLRPHSSTYLQEGPFETQGIIDGLQTGRFQFSQYAWHVGMNQWMRIGDLREFDRRSRSRDSKPHVPPPLPDPIAAVLLEDDSDSEAEEFHVTMRGLAKQDMTPNPLDSMQALNVTLGRAPRGSVGMGGAAVDSPEEKTAQQKANKAVALVSTPNLAGVPWEQDVSDGYAASVELIDDEHSGIDFRRDETPSHEPRNAPVFVKVEAPDGLTQLDKTPLPFVPSAPRLVVQDAWTKWGRHAAAGTQALIAIIFLSHLTLSPAESLRSTSSRKTRPAPADNVIQEVASAAPIEVSSSEPSAVVPTESAATTPAPTTAAAPAGTDEASSPAALVAKSAEAAVAIPRPPPLPVDFGIVGLKLESPDAQIAIQGSLPIGVAIAVTFKGRLGQILSKMSVRKTVSVNRKGGEIPTLRLKDLKLPAGAYTVEVDAGGARAKNEIFIGTRDKKFLDRLEMHLREISFETQSQKKALFYAAKELDLLARELGQNYGQLRTKPEQWTAFFKSWNRKVETIQRSLAELGQKKSDEQAYPEETAQLFQAFTSLNDVAGQYDQATRQSRDVASDALTELIAELTRQREAIGETTARPTADTPDGML